MRGFLPALLALAVGLLLAGCRPQAAKTTGMTVPAPAVAPFSPRPDAPGLYQDVAERAGLRFQFTNGAKGRHYLIETTGSGCAFFDYDNDGYPDILLLQAGELPGAPRDTTLPHNRLYHNNGDGTFTDVTVGSGLEDTGYAQGVAVGDYDGDGYDDLFIAGYGGNHLFHNEGKSGGKGEAIKGDRIKGDRNKGDRKKGKEVSGMNASVPLFRDVTQAAGLADTKDGPRWCSSAAWGDYDRDGKLDLYVCRYARWSPQIDKECHNPRGQSSYCSPEMYAPEVHALYHNNGNGTFTDVSHVAGIDKARGHGLSVAWLDYDGDGWEDIFVANDLSPYMLWHNNGNGTFTEVGMQAGVALSDMGSLLSGMGIGVRDAHGKGREDIFVTNFSGQMNVLYRNEGKGLFTNVTTPSGVGPFSMKHLAFGCDFLDYDRDGWPDLIIGNGHVNEDVETYSQGDTYKQAKSLLHNNGDGTFSDVTQNIGDLARPHVTRGLAVADYDLDGHLDILTNNQDGPPELLHYTGPDVGHWFALETHGVKSNPNGYHARVTLQAGGRTQFAEVRSGSSYASHSSSRLYFGLGSATTIENLKIVWYGSKTVTLAHNLPADHLYRVVEGQNVRSYTPVANKTKMMP